METTATTTEESLRPPLPAELTDRTDPFTPPAARAVLSDPRFSSDRFRNDAMVRHVPEQHRKRLRDEKMRAGSFIGMDPPEHTRYRRLLTGQFTVRRMRQLGSRVEQIVTEQLDAMLAKGNTADLVPSFALPVPSLVICELLGVSYADRAEFQRRTATMLLIAGHETTANMLALGTFALLQRPDQLAALRADPDRIDTAIEELLRYLTIIHLGLFRIPTEDVEIGGERIPAGSTVVISVLAANRDEQHWPDPDALDVTRARGPHLAFGHGVHQCLGQQLARVEMSVGFTHLLRRLPDLRLAVPPEEVPLRNDMFIFGVHALPVTWDAP